MDILQLSASSEMGWVYAIRIIAAVHHNLTRKQFSMVEFK